MKRLLNLCPPYCHAVLLAGGLIFSAAAYSQSGQKYAVGGNNLDENDQLGSKNNAPLRFVTNNNERARFTPSGNFGVGTTTPNATLSVNGSFQLTDGNQQNGYVLTSDGSGIATWQSLSSNNTGLWQKSGSDIFYNAGNVSAGNNLSVGNRLEVGSFFKAGNDTVKITSNYSAINSSMFCIGGLMGVGGAVPTVALDVQGDFKLTGNSEVGGTFKLPALAGAETQILGIDAQGQAIVITGIGDNPQCSQAFPWGKPFTNSNDIILCKPTGNVGIGNGFFTPNYKLHVVGNGFFSDDLTIGAVNNNADILTNGTVHATDHVIADNKIGIGTAAPFEPFHIKNDDPCIGLDINSSSSNSLAEVRFKRDGVIEARVFWDKSDDNLYLMNNSIRALKVNTQGQVIIGDETQISGSHTDYSLAVDGKIVARDLYVSESDWGDFVFEKDYTLMPLNELDAYVSQNKHLPGIAPASKVEEEGISVAEQLRMLTIKVEELTLYTIQQEKKIQELNQALAEKETK